VRLMTENQTVDKTVDIDEKEQNFYIECDDEPKSVDVNPEMTQLIEFAGFNKSDDMLIWELEHADSVVTRVRAAQKLADKDKEDCIEALARAIKGDSAWWVQMEAARSLGSLTTEEVKEKLIAAIDHPEPDVREQVARALGNFVRDESVVEPLAKMLEEDRSLRTASEAARSLGKLDLPDKTRKILARNMKVDSFRDTIRIAVIDALSDFEDPNIIRTLDDYTERDQGLRVRCAAIRGMGQLGQFLEEDEQDDLLDTLLDFLEDDNDRIRRAAMDALADLGNPRAIDNLRAHERGDPSSRLKETARRTISRIQDHQKDLPKENADRIEELEQRQKEMEKTIEELKRRIEEKEE